MICRKQEKKLRGAGFFILLLGIVFLTSCGSSRDFQQQKTLIYPGAHNPYHDIHFNDRVSDKTDKIAQIIDHALSFRGTPYQYGGTSYNGIDCSGLIYRAFQMENISFPRISRNMAKRGMPISKNEIRPGDLLFFQTGGSNRISHVGLVVKHSEGIIRFVHASTSSGVMVSALKNPYWQEHYVMAKRVF